MCLNIFLIFRTSLERDVLYVNRKCSFIYQVILRFGFHKPLVLIVTMHGHSLSFYLIDSTFQKSTYVSCKVALVRG